MEIGPGHLLDHRHKEETCLMTAEEGILIRRHNYKSVSEELIVLDCLARFHIQVKTDTR